MKRKAIRRFFRFLGSLIKKIIGFLFFCSVLVLAWHFFPWERFAPKVDTTEVDKYYELLRTHEAPANVLTLSAGIENDDDVQATLSQFGMKGKDSLPTALKRLQGAMGLDQYPINLIYGDQDKPPAFIENRNGQSMTITVSRKIKKRREQLNLLVHELSHVSVWALDPVGAMNCGQEKASDKSVLVGCNLERVVDTSGFFRGQGLLTLNGLTDETTYMPGEGYSTEKKLFGYLKPEQFGYLFARYCAEHGISARAVTPFLEPAGRKYFNIGRDYLERTAGNSLKITGEPAGVYWCPVCGERIKVNLSGDSPEIQCPKCSFHLKTKSWWDYVASLYSALLRQVALYRHRFGH